VETFSSPRGVFSVIWKFYPYPRQESSILTFWETSKKARVSGAKRFLSATAALQNTVVYALFFLISAPFFFSPRPQTKRPVLIRRLRFRPDSLERSFFFFASPQPQIVCRRISPSPPMLFQFHSGFQFSPLICLLLSPTPQFVPLLGIFRTLSPPLLLEPQKCSRFSAQLELFPQ